MGIYLVSNLPGVPQFHWVDQHNVRFQKISIPTPGVSKAKNVTGKYEAKLEIPGGWVGGWVGVQTKNPSVGGTDIFWNHTIYMQLLILFDLLQFLCFK